MISVRRRVTSRLAATAVATALFAGGALATAGAAAADEGDGNRGGGAKATLTELETFDTVEVQRGNRTSTYHAGLFSMEVEGGGTVKTYCIDFGTPALNGHAYQETGWSSSSLAENPDAGKIHWILQNSYPKNDDLAALAETAGANELTAEQAAAGTQAAIWYYSDGVDASPTSDDAQALTDWLLANAEELPEPEKPSLELTPDRVGGLAGESLGPVTVNTNADSVVVTPDADAAGQGVSLVDGNGELITEGTPVPDGTELFFDVPADAEPGTASVTASVTTSVPLGRAFTGVSTKTQTMILAGSTGSSVEATAKAKWSEGDEPAPSVTAQEDCVAGGVAVTVTNNGAADYEFTLNDETQTVGPGESGTITVPVDNKQAYDITVLDSDGETVLDQFTGVLDCEVAGPGDEGDKGEVVPDGDGDEIPSDSGPDLAETGSSTNVGLIVGIAAVLLLAGGAAVFFLRKKTASASTTS